MTTNPGSEEWAQQPPQGGGFPPPGPQGGAYPPPPYNQAPAGPIALPKSLDMSVKLWIAAAAVSLIHSILTIVNTNALVDEYAARLGVDTSAASANVSGVGSVIFQIILIGVWLFFVFKMREGQNWARIVLTVIGGITVLLGVIALFALGVLFSIGGLGVIEVLFSLASLATVGGAIFFQFKADANPYFVRR
ncbi:MAG: putative rane protein [Amycolatopsis sp.]|uniref:hypothetical protein n=1 Tax=Amycolatopsis sp. TaxID=37632 RepID=UPI00261A5ACF|nr:hypothetical protein [Amycolatopsis sp.]MCU1681094.1 putative rane protein [Amycolatopsis sp.]